MTSPAVPAKLMTRAEVATRMALQRDLSGTDMSGADLASIKLTGIKGQKADLANANLAGALIAGADLSASDLSGADLVVAVKEIEHRPLMADQFPAWVDRIEYWHIDDLDCAQPEEALPQLEAHVEALIERLAVSEAA